MKQQWTLSGFADEIAPELATQLSVLGDLGINHIEVRSVDNINILDLDDDRLAAVKAELDDKGFTVSSIGSPIGKVPVTETFDPYLERFERALYAATTLGARYIRIFSFYLAASDKDRYRGEVIARLGEFAKRAEAAGLVLLHENEKEIYGDTAESCVDLLRSVDSPSLRAVFDPANFLQVGVQPYPDAYQALREWIEYVHVKDATAADGTVTPAGQGDARFPELLDALEESGYEGFLSLEPHLAAGSQPGGGAEMFTLAATSLRGLLEHRANVDVR